MTLLNKIKWILAVVVVFFLVLSTNLIDRQNFITVKDSVETIYKDRLLAQSIIYEISKEVSLKEVAYVKNDHDELLAITATINDRIAEDVALFATTKLTSNEEATFTFLQKSLEKLKTTESLVVADKASADQLFPNLAIVRKHLDELIRIQVSEGQRQLQITTKAIGSMNLFTQIEVISLIILAIVIQMIIVYLPKTGDDV